MSAVGHDGAASGPKPRRAPRAPHSRRIVLLALAVALAGACEDVLGTTGYKDAIEELCGVCDNIADCRSTLEEKLDAASPDEVNDWLSYYDQLGCYKAECTTKALQCFYSAPGNCTEAGAVCGQSEQCCGFAFADPHGGAGCCAKGGGMCCDRCLTCAEALGADPPDTDTVCRSQNDALASVIACREANCKIACQAPQACNDCMMVKCAAQLATCQNDQDP